MRITAAAASGFMCFYYSAGGCRWWVTCPVHLPPVPLLALLHSRAVSLLGTFPRPWRAQPCFHTLQHGGTRDPACRAPFSDASRRPPMRALIGGEEAVPPPGIQRRLTREPHVTEVGQRCAESEGLFNSSLCSPPLSQRATERVCRPSAAGPRCGSRGDFTRTQNNLEEKRDEG